MAQIFLDTFTEAADTALVSHTPNVGTSWSEVEDTTGGSFLEVKAEDTLAADASFSSARLLYTANCTPQSNQYDVEITLPNVHSAGETDDPIGLLARYVDVDNYYAVVVYQIGAAADVKIVKKVASVVTELASGDTDWANGDVLRFEVRDKRKKVYKNDVELLVTTDNVITSVGLPGVFFGNVANATDDVSNSWRLDDFEVNDYPAVVSIATNTEDFSHADYTGVATPTVTVNTQAAPAFAGGAAGMADTLEDANASGQSLLHQRKTGIPNDSSDWIVSLYVRKDAVTDRFPELVCALELGSTPREGDVKMNTSTGAIENGIDGTPDAKGIEDVDATWWRLWMRMANNSSGNTRILAGVYPSRYPNMSPGTGAGSSFVGSFVAWGLNITNTSTLQDYEPDPFYEYTPLSEVVMTFKHKIGVTRPAAFTPGIAR